jgi:hypothetical protein
MEEDQNDAIERLRTILTHANEKRESSFSKFVRRIIARLRPRKRKAIVEAIEVEKKKDVA